MKFKMHTSADEKRAELSIVKSVMEIGILLLAALEILCEFFYTRYFDYIIACISFAECGLFLYGYFLLYLLGLRVEFSAEKYDALIDYHNTFMTSIVVPLIFIFSNSNTSFENTRITNPELLKKITVLIVLSAMLYYRMIRLVLKRIKIAELTAEIKARYQRCTDGFILGAFCVDMLVMGCVMLYFFAMLNKEESLANLAGLFALLIAVDVFALNRVAAKTPVFRIGLLIFTAIYIFFGCYNVYLLKDAEDFHFKKADYCLVTDRSDGSKIEQYCRLEDGENGKEILKYVLVYTDPQGNAQTGTSVYEFAAIAPIEGFFRWYDADHAYVPKKEMEKNEKPAVISVSRENDVYDDDFQFVTYLKNDRYVYTGEQGDEREWLAEGEEHLKFRGMAFPQTETVPDAMEAILDAMVLP